MSHAKSGAGALAPAPSQWRMISGSSTVEPARLATIASVSTSDQRNDRCTHATSLRAAASAYAGQKGPSTAPAPAVRHRTAAAAPQMQRLPRSRCIARTATAWRPAAARRQDLALRISGRSARVASFPRGLRQYHPASPIAAANAVR